MLISQYKTIMNPMQPEAVEWRGMILLTSLFRLTWWANQFVTSNSEAPSFSSSLPLWRSFRIRDYGLMQWWRPFDLLYSLGLQSLIPPIFVLVFFLLTLFLLLSSIFSFLPPTIPFFSKSVRAMLRGCEANWECSQVRP